MNIGDTNPAVRCGECGREMILRKGATLFYACSLFSCKATVNARMDGSPEGAPPTLALMMARKKALAAFSALWSDYPKREHKNRRATAYAWLAEMLRIPVIGCHIMRFETVAQCERVVEICEARKQREMAAV